MYSCFVVTDCKRVTLVPSQCTILTIIFPCYIPKVQSNKEFLQLLATCRKSLCMYSNYQVALIHVIFHSFKSVTGKQFWTQKVTIQGRLNVLLRKTSFNASVALTLSRPGFFLASRARGKDFYLTSCKEGRGKVQSINWLWPQLTTNLCSCPKIYLPSIKMTSVCFQNTNVSVITIFWHLSVLNGLF